MEELVVRRRGLLAVLAALMVAACGKKGTLRLPEPEEEGEERR